MIMKLGNPYFDELEMPTSTSKHTTVLVEKDFKHNAPHEFHVVDSLNRWDLCRIHFQEGPIKEYGVNGVTDEDLLHMVLCRLQHFQESEFACGENENAAECIETALGWLRIRRDKRERRGVADTNEV